MTHDPMCPDYASAHANICSGEYCDDCQCDLIAKVRANEAPKAVTRWIEQGAASDDWMKVWQVRDYAEELDARVRADTLDKAEAEIRKVYAGYPDLFCELIVLRAIDNLRGAS